MLHDLDLVARVYNRIPGSYIDIWIYLGLYCDLLVQDLCVVRVVESQRSTIPGRCEGKMQPFSSTFNHATLFHATILLNRDRLPTCFVV